MRHIRTLIYLCSYIYIMYIMYIIYKVYCVYNLNVSIFCTMEIGPHEYISHIYHLIEYFHRSCKFTLFLETFSSYFGDA